MRSKKVLYGVGVLFAMAVIGLKFGVQYVAQGVSSQSTPAGVQTADAPQKDTSSCEGSLTASTTAGPYYVTNTKLLQNGELNYDHLPGEAIRIFGYVYHGKGSTAPLAKAYVDVWQADAQGSYWPAGNKDAAVYTDAELSLRGGIFSNDDGYYEFTTIYPGEYEGRARHIHFHVIAPGGQEDVTTQLILTKEGDHTPASADRLAATLPPCNIAHFTLQNGMPAARFDLHL